MDGKVGNCAIKRGAVKGLAKNVIHARELRFALADVALGRIQLSAGLGHARLVLGSDGFGNFIGCFFGVKILLGDELVFVEVLSAIIVELGAGQISRTALGLSNGGIEGGLGGNSVSLIAGQLRL